jgi:hypothetical protein
MGIVCMSESIKKMCNFSTKDFLIHQNKRKTFLLYILIKKDGNEKREKINRKRERDV